jgi:hypothetical protein
MMWEKPEGAASVQRAAELLDTTVEFVEQDFAYDLRRCVPNALLNIAVSRLIRQEGRDGALRVLTALAAALAAGEAPVAGGPVPRADVRRGAVPDKPAGTAYTANVVQMR